MSLIPVAVIAQLDPDFSKPLEFKSSSHQIVQKKICYSYSDYMSLLYRRLFIRAIYIVACSI